MNRLLALVLLASPLLSSCGREPEVWTAFVYPPGRSLDAADAQRAIYGTYPTFEECQSSAIWALREHRQNLEDSEQEAAEEKGWGDYECGVGCRFEKEHDLYMCKETRK